MMTFAIDCHDPRPTREAITVRHGDSDFCFAFAPQAKRDMAFHAGLFVDEAAVNSRACYRYPRSRRACLLKESPIKPFYRQVNLLEKRYDRVFTFDRDLVDRGSPFKLLYYGTSWLGNDWRTQSAANAQKTQLVSFVGNIQHEDAHGYSLRREVARRLQQDGRVECFGKGIREIRSKLEGLQRYCFSVAMENIRKDYYFTEKLIDCFLTGTVPIYWGCPGIGDVFDLRGILRFNTIEDLRALLDSVSPERYQAMLPFVQRNMQVVLTNHWDSEEGLFHRIAEDLSQWLAAGQGVGKRFRGRLAAFVRWLMDCARPARPSSRT
jgi:hypothetical protein